MVRGLGPKSHGHSFLEVGEELTVSSTQSKDCDLSCSVQLVDAVLFCPNVYELSPLCPEAVSKYDPCFAVEHGVCGLLQFASHV